MSSNGTTVAGILALLAGLAHAGAQYYSGQHIDMVLLMGSVSMGLGLIGTKGSSEHSTPEQVEQAGTAAQLKKAA